MHLIIHFWKCTKNIFAVAANVFHFLMKKSPVLPQFPNYSNDPILLINMHRALKFVQSMRNILHIFVCFSESPNFTVLK